MHFVDVLVRQAHPGPGVPPYRTFERKLEDARAYRREEAIPWPVVVDDVRGTAHQAYGTLADPTYLVDTDGRVAYYNIITSAPVLHEAIEALLAQGSRGVAGDGLDRGVHLLPMLTDGWRGIARGLPQSAIDLMIAAPGSPILLWLGHRLRPLLAPLTLRAEPLPAPLKAALAAAASAGFALAFGLTMVRAIQRRRERRRRRSRLLGGPILRFLLYSMLWRGARRLGLRPWWLVAARWVLRR